MTLRLKCIEGPIAGEIFNLAPQDSYTVGRQNDSDIVLPSPRVSRRHAELLRYGRHLFVRDLNSQNGTFLNDRKLEGQNLGMAVQMAPKDRLSLGDFILEFEAEISDSDPVHAPGEEAKLPVLPNPSGHAPQVYPILADLILEIFAVERLCLMGFDAERKTLFPLYFANSAGKGDAAAFEPSAMVLHQLMNEKRTVFTVDAAADSRFSEGKSILEAGVRAIICAPMLQGTELRGGLYIDALHRNHQLSPQHQAWLESFAMLLAQFI